MMVAALLPERTSCKNSVLIQISHFGESYLLKRLLFIGFVIGEQVVG
jgi:hypothetical protein